MKSLDFITFKSIVGLKNIFLQKLLDYRHETKMEKLKWKMNKKKKNFEKILLLNFFFKIITSF